MNIVSIDFLHLYGVYIVKLFSYFIIKSRSLFSFNDVTLLIRASSGNQVNIVT